MSQRDTDPEDPLSAVFSVHNDYAFQLYDLKVICAAREIRSIQGGGVAGLSIEMHPDTTTLEAGASTDVSRPCGVAISPASFDRADFNLVVQFRPKFWPWQKTVVSRFMTERHGKRVIWIQNPLPWYSELHPQK
jgi:hypothetical protein